MELDVQIEGVLFYKTEPMKKAALAAFFKIDPEELEEALEKLSERLQNGATRLVSVSDTVQLVVTSDLSPIIETLRKDDLRRDIGKAGAETLAIILYRGPVSRIEIDKIRGVNSTFILRNLLIRGLIERLPHPTDQRSFVYQVTPALLNHLGISRREALPEFEDIMNSLDAFEKQQADEETREPTFT